MSMKVDAVGTTARVAWLRWVSIRESDACAVQIEVEINPICRFNRIHEVVATHCVSIDGRVPIVLEIVLTTDSDVERIVLKVCLGRGATNDHQHGRCGRN
jgi:hypothetical protein